MSQNRINQKLGDSVNQLDLAKLDLRESFANKHLWLYAAWRDVQLRYLNSKLGPLWITISTGVFASCFAVIGATLFNTDIKAYLPFLIIGFVTWLFITQILTEGADIFTSNQHILLNQSTPFLALIFRLILRTSIASAHHMIVLIVVFFFTDVGISTTWFMSLIGVFLLTLFLFGMVLTISIFATKYRDIPQLLASILQVAFFFTPVMWDPSIIVKAGQRYIVDVNPLHHFLSIIRNPLLGQPVDPMNYLVAVVCTVFFVGLGVSVFVKYRSKITYWI